jgi:hypothetical protein
MASIGRKIFYSLNKMRRQSWVQETSKKIINRYYKKLFGAPALTSP